MIMEAIWRSVAKKRKLTSALKIICYLATTLTVADFLFILFGLLGASAIVTLKYLAVLGLPFALVSFLRRFVAAPRPYEVCKFTKKAPKESKGDSFPSRHAFSIFAIGTLTMFIFPIFGAILLVFGVLMSVARVLLGYHFPRDVIAGALIGIASSLIGTLFLK